MQEVQFLGGEDPLEEEMAAHSSILGLGDPMDRGAWRATIHGVAELHATEHMMDVDLQVNGITQCEGSPDWLLSTSLTFSRFLPVVVSASFHLVAASVHRVDGARLLGGELRDMGVASHARLILF